MRALGASALTLALSLAVALSGCGGNQSPLSPESGPARKIADLWWGMLAAAGVVFAGALVLLALAWRRRDRSGLPLAGEREGVANGLVVAFGIVIPVLALTALFAVANVGIAPSTEAQSPTGAKLTIDVIGHQWWWEVHYPGTAAVTANEIHIPARTRVNVVATTADVIHSFWVPRLNRKIDMVPGLSNRVELYSDKVGEYRGQCSQYCGYDHALMGLEVFVDPPDRFRAWLASMAQPLVSPTGAAARRGEQVFLSEPCSSCHMLRGTAAQGTIGPDLTHLATRTTLAATTIPNRPDDLASWIRDPQHVKPGNHMPALALSAAQQQDLVAFLEGLR